MNVRRTPWWYYAMALALGSLIGVGLTQLGEAQGMPLVGAPWFVSVLLALLGLMVLILALQVHKYARTDPRKRPHTFVNPPLAAYTLVLAKALGLAGAALAGFYGGQILLSVGHIEAPFYREAVIQCVVAAVICLIDMIIGIVGEWLCQLPPTEGKDNPKMKAAEQQRALRQTAPTAAKQRD